MRLTLRSEYGLLALVFLARNEKRGFVSVSEIAGAQNIPGHFLEQILLVLKRAGYVRSRKGRNGGFRLARPCSTVSLADVVRALDGPLAPTESVSRFFYGPTPIEREKKLLGLLREIRDLVAARMEGATLADVL